jgi:hypothetical protein
LSVLFQVINSEAEDSDDDEDVDDDVTDGEEEISGPFQTLTARPPMDIEELAR